MLLARANWTTKISSALRRWATTRAVKLMYFKKVHMVMPLLSRLTLQDQLNWCHLARLCPLVWSTEGRLLLLASITWCLRVTWWMSTSMKRSIAAIPACGSCPGSLVEWSSVAKAAAGWDVRAMTPTKTNLAWSTTTHQERVTLSSALHSTTFLLTRSRPESYSSGKSYSIDPGELVWSLGRMNSKRRRSGYSEWLKKRLATKMKSPKSRYWACRK
jgi:hypothetical protein